MAFIRRDFIKETSTVTGTGPITLNGVRSPGSTFASVCSNGDTFRYAISNQSGPSEWEVGLGTYNAGANTITRSPVASSNANALVNFSVGTKFVDIVVDTAQFDAFLTTAAAGGGIASFSTHGSGLVNITGFTDSTMSGQTVFYHQLPNTLTSAFSFANVSFRFSGNSMFGAVAALYAAGSVSSQNFSQAQNLYFANSNGVTFGASSSAAVAFGRVYGVTALVPRIHELHAFNLNATQQQSVSLATDSTISGASSVTLGIPIVSAGGVNDQNFSSANVFFKFSSNSLLGMVNHRYVGGTFTATNNIAQAQQLSLSDANGVSFGLNTVTTAALGRVVRLSASFDPRIGLVSHIGGNSVGSVTQLAFSNSNNVSWTLSTAASAATVIASVAAGGGGITNINVSAGTTSQNLSNVVFSNSNGVSFGLNGSTVTASVATSLTAVNLSAGTTSNNLSAFVFSNSNNVSFGLNGSTVTATATVATSLSNINVSAGTTSQNLSAVVFSNLNGVSFGLNGSTVTASVAAGGGGGGLTLSALAPFYGGVLVDNFYGLNSLFLHPVVFPDFQFDRVVHPILLSRANTNSAQGTHSVTLRAGVYTITGSTLSRLATTSFSFSAVLSTGNGNSSSWSGLRMVSFGWTTTFTGGQHWYGLLSSVSSSGASASQFTIRNGMYSQSVSNFSGYFGSTNGTATNNTIQMQRGQGRYSATTSDFPGAVTLSQIQGPIAANNSAAFRPAAMFFHSGTA